MRVVVVGAGAIGSLLGARCAAAGHDVTLVARREHVTAIRSGGLRIEGIDPIVVHPRAETGLPHPFDAALVLLTVKTFDLAVASAEVGRATADVPVLLPQNGLGVEPTAAAAFRDSGWRDPDRWIVRAVNSIPATLLGPGAVRAAGQGEILLEDPSVAGPSSRSGARFLELFRSAGVPVRPVADLRRELWRKVVVNAAINPVSALHGVPNGALLTEPLRSESIELLGEAVSVARAEKVPFALEEAEQDFQRVARATAENRSSMLQDLDRGRRTEVDAILGELVRRAGPHDLPLPATRRALDAVHRRRASPRSPPQPS